MKIVDLASTPSSLAEVLDLAGEDAILLKAPGGREFILAEVDDFEAEVEQVRQHPELLEFLAQRSSEKKTYSLAEVRERLKL
ncbi:MAG TPA: hypothetical protein VFE33_10980 [Thermoanaerobaculia bacterium]|nr:hypothetical protein [Thermoanaerobaculia bacterium]